MKKSFIIISSILSLIFIITSCFLNKEKVTFTNHIKGNTIYFTIKNNSENEPIIFLKPKHNYLCYEDGIFTDRVYKDYFKVGLMNKKDSLQSYKPTLLKSCKSTLSFPDKYEGLSNYDKIEIKKNEVYSDSILIPTIDTEDCIFYPIINEETIVFLMNDTIIYK